MRREAALSFDYTGKSPDSRRARRSVERVFVPVLQKQFPEIEDLSPAGGVLLPIAVVRHEKAVPDSKRVMLGSGALCGSSVTKFIIVTDHDIDIREWKEVVWR